MVGLREDVILHCNGRGNFDQGFVVDLILWLSFVGEILFSEVEEGFREVGADFVECGQVRREFGLFAGEVVFYPKRK